MRELNTPDTILAEYSLQSCQQPQLLIISGESGAGKTTACQLLIRQAREQGCLPAGWVSPPVYLAGEKIGIDLTDIASGETRRLAWKRERDHAEDGAELTTRGWQFDPAVVAWGNRILDELPTGPLLILDELGPLEFQKQAGFSSGLRLLDERQHRAACVVIRTACLTTALDRWPWARVFRVPVPPSIGGKP